MSCACNGQCSSGANPSGQAINPTAPTFGQGATLLLFVGGIAAFVYISNEEQKRTRRARGYR